MSKKITPLEAIIRYERAASLVTSLTQRIGLALNQCINTGLAMESEFPGADTMALWNGNRIKTHLWEAYHEVVPVYQDEGRRLTKEEQKKYLVAADCPHCLEAWQLIEQRKQARMAFGAAKRVIRSIGKASIAKEPA